MAPSLPTLLNGFQCTVKSFTAWTQTPRERRRSGTVSVPPGLSLGTPLRGLSLFVSRSDPLRGILYATFTGVGRDGEGVGAPPPPRRRCGPYVIHPPRGSDPLVPSPTSPSSLPFPFPLPFPPPHPPPPGPDRPGPPAFPKIRSTSRVSGRDGQGGKGERCPRKGGAKLGKGRPRYPFAVPPEKGESESMYGHGEWVDGNETLGLSV